MSADPHEGEVGEGALEGDRCVPVTQASRGGPPQGWG